MADTPNNLDNTYYQGVNHIRLARSEANRSFIFDAAVQRATSLGKTIESGARISAGQFTSEFTTEFN